MTRLEKAVRDAAIAVLHYGHCDHSPPDPDDCTHCHLAQLVGFHGDVAEKGLAARKKRREED